MNQKPKIIRACTVPMSLVFVKGMIPDLQERYEVVLLSSDGPEWKDIEQQFPEVKCIKLNMARHISLVGDVKSLWKMWRTMRQERPTMVHSMTPKAGMLCMVAAWLARVSVRIHTFTGLVFPSSTGLKRRILMVTDWLTCACATHIIPEGEGVKKDLLNNDITKKPIHVLGYGNCKGIDLTRYDRNEDVMAVADSLRKTDVLTFISVGRLVGDKGINEMVEAFVKLHEEFPKTRLLLVGSEEQKLDPLKPETLARIKDCKAIECVGKQSDVRPWFAASDVAILASYREGFPNVVIEAGAMGLPQIVTDINGANEIIVDDVNGTIVPPQNSGALYEAMKRMLDKEYRNRLAEHAREMIASRYDQGFVRKCLYDFYDEILSF